MHLKTRHRNRGQFHILRVMPVAISHRASRAFLTASMLAASCLMLGATPQAPSNPTPPAASATAIPSNDAGLTTLATSLLDDWVSRTTAPALEAAMLPGCQMINYRGAFDRAGAAKALVELGDAKPKVLDVIATRVGDALVATCMLSIGESVDGTALPTAASPRIGVWLQSEGAWKLAAWGSLNMPAARPAPAAPTFEGDATLNAEGGKMLAALLGAQHARKLDVFSKMLADGMQVINFKGQKVRQDIEQGARAATIDEPKIADARATRCGDLTVVTCTLTMGQKIGFTSLPADPAPFLAVFRGTGDAATVIAMANTNKPK
jgi:hypothetical protein